MLIVLFVTAPPKGLEDIFAACLWFVRTLLQTTGVCGSVSMWTWTKMSSDDRVITSDGSRGVRLIPAEVLQVSAGVLRVSDWLA